MEATLKRVEDTQRWTMEKIIKKRHKKLLPEWKDLFAQFFMGFLKGDYKSINDFLYNDRLGKFNESNLKKEFKGNI